MWKWLKSLFSKKPLWEYGVLRTPVKGVFGSDMSGRRVRRHRLGRNVQCVLWKAGEQGHLEDYWCNMDSSWWEFFVPDFKTVRLCTDCAKHSQDGGRYLFQRQGSASGRV